MAQTALITGAANGIGRSLALALIEKSFKLFLTDVDESALRTVFDGHICDTVRVSKLDVTDRKAWSNTVGQLLESFGRLDYLFNNAGIILPGWINETDFAAIDRQVDINLKGVLYGIYTASEQMVKQGQGHIINIASFAGVAPVPGISVYAATKHGVRGLSLSAAIELRDKGVYVSVIYPELVDTNMRNTLLDYDQAALAFSLGGKPLTPEVVVSVILKTMETNRMEVGFPPARYRLAKLISLFPSLLLWSYKYFEAKGDNRLKSLRKSR